MNFDYFYNRDAERFSFYKIPKLFFEEEIFRKLSSDAKLLYAILLDRTGLSFKSGWVDKENRVYIICTINEIQLLMNCSNKKAIKTLDELDGNRGGIGLIEKARLGLGKPNIIYVKDFSSKSARQCTNNISEVNNLHSRNEQSTLQEVNKVQATNTNHIKTDKSEIDFKNEKVLGIFENVSLSTSDLEELRSILANQVENYIERLSTYMKSTGSKYKDHKATILSWYFKEQKPNSKRQTTISYEKQNEGEYL